MKSITRTVVVAAAMFTPALASAAWGITLSFGSGGACGSYIGCLGAQVIGIINGVLVPVLFAVAFIAFLYGVAKAYIFSAGEPSEVEKGHKLILWGLVGFFVMVSLWGLVNVVANTFGLTGSYAPRPPVSYPLY